MSGRDRHLLSVPEGYRVGVWEVRAPIASGAFGSVYTARRTGPSTDLPSEAALKFLPTGTRTPRQLRHLRELAEREVDLLSRLRHPRLIRMYEALTVDDPEHPELDGATVLVLERAEKSLGVLLEHTPPGCPLPGGPALLAEICAGLEQLHRAGWVHGDLKPGNVLLMPDGSVRLGDFNLAAELEGTHAYSPAFATPDFAPPELLWSEIGERGMQIRTTADIWAFGVLAHLVLTGAHPLPGGVPSARRDAVVGYARGTEELRLSPELPERWREIITDCLARTHQDRAAHDAASLLRRVGEAAGTTGTTRPPRRPVFGRRSRARVPLAVTAAVAALAGLGFGVHTLTNDGEAAGPGSRTGAAHDRPGTGGGETAVARPSATPTGYDRCLPGSVCFFTEKGGKGDMCAWEGDDTNWPRGEIRCSWAGREHARSVFNNGHDTSTGETFVHVVYYAEAGLRSRRGCVEVGTREDFPAPVLLLSHVWADTC